MPATPEKFENQEQSQSTDQEYYSSVQRHFNSEIEILHKLDPEGENEENEEYIMFLRNAEKSLSRISRPKELAKTEPKDIALGMSALLNEMAASNPDNPRLDEDQKEIERKNFLETKDIFTSTCKKTFPEVSLGSNMKQELSRELRSLSQQLKAFDITITGMKVEGKTDEELARMISDKISVGRDIGDIARAEFKKSREDEGTKEKLADMAKSLYKLQLIRDRLEEQVANVQFDEQKKSVERKDEQDVATTRAELEDQFESELSPEILDIIKERGRLVSTVSVDGAFAKERKLPGAGFNTFTDQKSSDTEANRRLIDWSSQHPEHRAFNKTGDPVYDLNKNNIATAITITPITESVPIYENRTVKKGLFRREETEQIHIGEKEEVISIGKFNGNEKDAEPAYRIVYYAAGTKENPSAYGSDYSGRSGNRLESSIIIPESIARQVFTAIEKNPELAKDIMRTLDPKLMENQAKNMVSKNEKMLIVPEGADAFKKDDDEKVVGIKSEYIKTSK